MIFVCHGLGGLVVKRVSSLALFRSTPRISIFVTFIGTQLPVRSRLQSTISAAAGRTFWHSLPRHSTSDLRPSKELANIESHSSIVFKCI